MEPQDAVENVPHAAQAAEPDSRGTGEPRGTKPAAAPLDPLERLGLVFFALMLVGLFYVVPVVRDILKAPARAAPVYKVSAAELDAAYASDSRVARERYDGKQVILTGSVHSFGRDANGAPYVDIGATGSRAVRCVFGKEEPELLAGLKKGKQVTVHGTCEGYAPPEDVVIRATNLQ